MLLSRCDIPSFFHSIPLFRRGILLSRRDILSVCRCLPLSHHRPPTIFCCISSFCCRISLSHRGIFFVRCSILFVCCITPLLCHHSLLFRRHTFIVRCKKAFLPPGHASHPPISQKAYVTPPAKSSYYPFVCIAEDERFECRQRAVVSAFLRIDRLMRNALRRTFFLYTPAPHRKLQ